ncbi:hypothetical protein [Sphingomonas profundi]|uniref:hypothetical protein n=1 Tax=Alterirhizorhabdus profundi TaxID=2681549 RepID=UPI0012E8DEBF|nr:hypothetical protein [Sphingomonas profundi]
MTPLRRSAGLLSGALLLLASPGVAAIGRQPAPLSPLSDADFRALMAPALTAAQAQDCPKVLGMIDPVLPRVSGRNRNAAQLLRLPCLVAAGRTEEATAVYREISASDPRSGLIRSVGVVVALSSGDFVEAGNRLASLAEEDPTALSRLTGTVARGITQALTESRSYAVRDRVFIALARADWQPQDRPEMRDGLAQGAIDALIGAGRSDEALTLLPRVGAPELLVGMAMERHYQPLWPAIETRLGDHGGTAVDRFAAARLDAFASRPDDPESRRDATRSFLLLGRYAEASETAAPARIAEAMDDADVTTVRYDAQALAAQGRTDEALARLRPFATLDLGKSQSAASGLVSLAELLDENGREEDALAVARTALAKGGPVLSAWGAGWLRRTEVCALAALGRRDEANRLGDALKADATRNEAATVEALLCLRRSDEAAALAIATLATPEGAGVLADQFQPEGALWAPARSRLRALWVTLLQRGDVKAAFDKTARILPQRFWPQRGARPIPRIARPDDVPVT